MSSTPYIQFYPTLRCNLNCHFCFNKGVPATPDVKVVDFEKIVFALREAGVEYIDMLGGEPTVHPELIQLLDTVSAYGMRSTISTNGTDVRTLRAVSERYDNGRVRIGMSLNSHGLSRDLHEYIVRHRPMLKSVLTKQATIPKTCEQYIGLSGIEYFLLYMDTVDNRDLEHSLPFYDFHRELVRLKGMYEGLDGVFCSGFIPHEKDDSLLRSVRCPAGTTKLSILPDGAVYPCYLFFRHKEFELGNILRHDFAEIWRNPILDNFRVFSGNTCTHSRCTLFSSCHGGCPAVSYIIRKDLNAPDPRCAQEERQAPRSLSEYR